MQAKLTKSQRTDGLDLAAQREMFESKAFCRFRERVEAELERARGGCEREREPEDIHRAQGSATALRAVLALPAQILKDMQAAGRANDR